MADLKQGISYEITAEDRTRQGTDSALANLIKAEKAAKDAANKERKEASDVKGLFGTVTQAISGNFEALGKKIAETAAKMKGLRLSGMALGAIGAIVSSVVTIVKSLWSAWNEVKEKIEAIHFENVLGQVDRLKKESEDVSRNIEDQRRNAESVRDVINTQVDATKRLKDAQLEYAKAQEMSLAKSDRERQLIEEKYASQGRINEREYAARKRQMQRDAADEDIALLEQELAAAKDRERRAIDTAGRLNDEILDRGRYDGFFSMKHRGENGRRNEEEIRRLGSAQSEAWEKGMEAISAQKDIERKIQAAREKRKALDVEEKAAKLSESAADVNDQTQSAARAEAELKQLDDETEKIRKEIERERREMANLARKDAESIARARAKAEADALKEREAAEKAAHERRKREIEDEVKAWGNAQNEAGTRLAAARAAVSTAWGWYRDKNSMASQLEEEKANAEAERQYEKDFARLSRRRGWETAKNLSVDDEAVRRVALARREEEAARKSYEDIAKMREIQEEQLKLFQEEL